MRILPTSMDMMKRSRLSYENEVSVQGTERSSIENETQAREQVLQEGQHLASDGFAPFDFDMTTHDRASPALPSNSTADSAQDVLWNQSLPSNCQKEEQSHFHDVCDSYRQYSVFAVQQCLNQQFRIQSLPPAQKFYLPDTLRPDSYANQQRNVEYKEAAIGNQFCLDCILRHAGQPHSQQIALSRDRLISCSEAQISKVSSVLKSLARDWSVEGRSERNMCYVPLLNSVNKHIPRLQPDGINAMRKPSRICVPGAGLGRLMCEISSLGYTVQGNEFSLPMLLASDFILNGPIKADQPLLISPWLLETRNVHSSSDQFRTVTIPDRDAIEIISSCVHHADELSEDADFSMAAGDFASVYSSPNEASAWDGIVASFFLDTSPCIIEYLQVCYQMLRPGGYLISFGPLLWHWSGPAMMDQTLQEYRNRHRNLDPKYLQSIDFCLEDIKIIMLKMGFEILECSPGHSAQYTADRRSMMCSEYQCVLLIARKGLRTSAIGI